jgi:PAS domain S-box-containing protein
LVKNMTKQHLDTPADQVPFLDKSLISMKAHGRNNARRWLEAIVDSSDDAIIGKDLTGTITAWNRAAEAMFGYSASEIINQPITRIIPPDRLEEEALILTRVGRNERIEHFETRRLRKDGVIIPVMISVSPIRDHAGRLIGISKIARDCRERDEREHQLRIANAKLVATIAQLEAAETSARLAIEGTGLGFINFYPRTKTVVLDERAGAMFGFASAAPLTDDAFLAALHPENRANWIATRETEYRRGEFVQEFRVIGSEDGRERFLMARGHAYRDGAVCQHVRCVVGDMTEMRVRQLDEQLRSKHDAAVEANAAKSRFLAAASHDLRQPLHAIAMFLSVLRSDPPAPRRKTILDNINAAVASMQRMFNGLLDVVRLDAGMMTARPETFSLQAAFDALCATFETSAQSKGLRLWVHPTSAVLTTDPVMLQSVLQNLVSNAISYTTRGEVAIEARQSPGGIAIEVRDSGCGIPPDRLEDVFREFVRLNRGGGSENGMGLGLAIVRRQVAEMGATVDVRSELDVGSVFTLNLPGALHSIERPGKLEEVVGPSLSGKRILLVDDHKMVLAALVMEVETWGVRALPAASADEAMTLLALMAPELPDAMVVDLDLGTKVSGVELLRQIQSKHRADIPALVVTGSTTAETLGMLNNSGYPWLTKPTDPGALHGALVAALGAAHGESVAARPGKPSSLGLK